MDHKNSDANNTKNNETNFRKLEDEGTPGSEPGRIDTEDKDGRPTGKSTARDKTGINPQEPIDPKSPNLI